MVDIVVTATVNGVPTNGLVQPPQVEIIRSDTGAVVQAFVAMTDLLVSGKYGFTFAPTVTLDYAFTVDADPTASGQVSSAERYFDGAFPGNIDTLADQGDLAPLANLDVAVSTRNATVPLAAAVDQAEHDATQAAIAAQVVPLDAATDQAEHDATQAAIAAQVVPLDAATDQAEHDATQAAIAAQVVPMDAATSQAEHDATQAGIGLNLAAIASLDTFIQGGREIDFVGDDVAGWQRVERDVGGTILRRYDLFDETDTRINETVASFIGRSGMIARETISP